MSIRALILKIFGGSAVITLISIIGAAYYFVGSEFSRIEENLAVEARDDIVALFQREKSQLEDKVGDWAQWNDTLDFQLNKTKSYIVNNMNFDSLSTLGVDFIAVSDGEKYFHAMKRDPEKESTFPFSSKELDILNQEPLFFPEIKQIDQHESGIYFYQDMPFLFSIHPITDSQLKTKPTGHLLFAIRLNQEHLQEVVKDISKQIYFFQLPQEIPKEEDFLIKKGSLKAANQDRKIDFYVLFPKLISKNGYSVLKSFTIFIILATLLLLSSFIFFLDKHLLTDLVLLSKQMLIIQKEKGFKNDKELVSSSETTEIKNLVQSINALLKNLQTSYFELSRESSSESLRELSQGLAHEINNPLAIISGSMESVESIAESNEEVKSGYVLQAADRVRKMVVRISDITYQLLELSRTTTEDDFIDYSLNSILGTLPSIFRHKMIENKVDFVVEPLLEDLRIECIPSSLIQAITHLINNSVDFISGVESAWIRVYAQKTQDKVQLHIIDSGSSNLIDENKIFDAFFTTKDVGSGKGLGLSYVRHVAEMHSGKAYLNKSNQNVEFVLEFPISQSKRSQIAS